MGLLVLDVEGGSIWEEAALSEELVSSEEGEAFERVLASLRGDAEV
jgi:hypothetical protein